MANAPENEAEIVADLARGLSLIDDKANHYAEARDFYEGRPREVFASALIRRQLELEARQRPLSFAHVPVDALSEKVQLAGIRAEGGEQYETALTEIIDDLDLLDEAEDWHLKALYFGDYYVVAKPLEETDDDEATVTRVGFSACSPLTTVMVYAPDDSRVALYGVRRWKVGSGEAERWRAAVYYDDQTVLFESNKGTNGTKGADYSPLVDDDGVWRVAHPGGMKLLVHFPVFGRPYGTPAHAKAFGPQEAITKISATNLATVESQGFPFRFALLDPAAEADDDLDADFGDDGPDTTPGDSDGLETATTGVSRIRAQAGAMALLRGIKQVGQLDSADSSGMLENMSWYLRAMAVATGTPLFEFDLNGEQPSGEARRRASGRINKRADSVKKQLGRAHRVLFDTMLALLGFDPVEARVMVSWKPSEVETDAEGLELVAAKVKQGVPLRTALSEAGYPSETVDEWFPGEDMAVSPDLALALGEALERVARARAVGALPDDVLSKVLPQLFGAVVGEGAEAARAAMDAAADELEE